MTTVIYHSADFDGLFCREIAKKFLGTEGVEYIGWDHGQPPVPIPAEGQIIIMDLPVDTVLGGKCVLAIDSGDLCFLTGVPTPVRLPLDRIIWIDHHKSAISNHPTEIPGYRIDGVAACRLAWQWFAGLTNEELSSPPKNYPLPALADFKERQVVEPMAVTLAGEYDIWDHAKSNGADMDFQLGLRSANLTSDMWTALLEHGPFSETIISRLLDDGRLISGYQKQADEFKMKAGGFLVQFEGLTFLALNSPAKSSMQFASMDVPETGHEALMKFSYNGKVWDFSLYHAAHRKDIDLSRIAVQHGGGGHAGACGFRAQDIAFSNGSKGSTFLEITRHD